MCVPEHLGRLGPVGGRWGGWWGPAECGGMLVAGCLGGLWDDLVQIIEDLIDQRLARKLHLLFIL